MNLSLAPAFALCALAALLAPAAASAAPPDGFATLTGHVYDMQLQPVRAAEVSVDGAGRAYTDLQGYFEIEGIPCGVRRVRVKADGFLADSTDLSFERRFVEFTTTLKTVADEGLPTAGRMTSRPVVECYAKPTLRGDSGLMELPDARVLPARVQTVAYSVFQIGQPMPRIRQRASHLSLTAGVLERLEVFAMTKDVSREPERVTFVGTTGVLLSGMPAVDTTSVLIPGSVEPSESGFGLKWSGRPFRLGEGEIAWALGGRIFSGRDDSAYLVLDVPAFDDDRLLLVPTWNDTLGEVDLHLGWRRTLSARGDRVASLMLEALQSSYAVRALDAAGAVRETRHDHQYKVFNAGLRFEWGRDRSAHVIWRHNALGYAGYSHYRGLGVGATMAFE